MTTTAADVAEWTTPTPATLLPHLTVVCKAGAPEDVWAAERRHGIGGSDVAAACGINKYESPFSLWLEKTGRGGREFDDEARERMKWGRVLEPIVRDEFQWLHPEYRVMTGEGTYALPHAPWQRVNLDGLVFDAVTGDLAGIWEGKAGSHWQLPYWQGEEVPVMYTAQVQWAMHITGARCAFVSALLDTNKYVEKTILRDDDLIADLVDLATELWGHVVTDTPPPIDGSPATTAALARMQERAGSVIDLDPAEWAHKIARIHAINQQINELKAAKEVIGNELRAAMGEHTIARIDGEKVATHKTVRASRSTDYDRLQAGWPDAYAACVTDPDNDPETASAVKARRLDMSRSKRALGVLADHTGEAV